MGARHDVELPDYPLPATNPADGKRHMLGLPLGPTCKDAIGDLPDAERFETLSDVDSVRTTAFTKPSAYAAVLRCMTNDAWHFGRVREWNPSILTSSARTVHTDISKRRFSATRQGSVEPISRFFKLSPSGLSHTLRAGTDGARGAFTSPRPIHYEHDRCITVREMARLHGFPDWFRFHATKWHGARQIGNAVPPPLARAVSAMVIKSLGLTLQPTSSELGLAERPLAMGDPELLYLELSEAAEHFGVKAPPSKRDRKSGTKKRKQADIENAQERLRIVNG